MRTSPRTMREADTVLVAVDGSATDRAVVEWAALEAHQARRRLLLVCAAGHLPTDLTYAERDVVRRHRLGQGHQVAGAAAEWVRGRVPHLRVDSVVRLLPTAMLLPVVAEQAHTVTWSGASWSSTGPAYPQAPVLVGHPHAAASPGLLHDASDYAQRRGVDLVVLEADGEELARRLVERSPDISLMFLARPERSGRTTLTWPLVLDTYERSRSPVVLVAPESRAVRSG